MKLAHFGAFDAHSYGDLMQPLLLEHRLSGLCGEFVHVAPAEGGPPLEDRRPNTAFEEFMDAEANADGVILGGGVFGTAYASPPPDGPHDILPSLYREGLWLGAAYVAARDGSPLAWNAPGLPDTTHAVTTQLLRWAASVSDYVSVRDDESRRILEGAGVPGVVATPDIVLGVAGIWSEPELEKAYHATFRDRGREIPARTLVLDLSGANEEEPEALARVLDDLCASATPILVDLEDLYGAHRGEWLQRIAGSMKSEPLLLNDPRSLREISACIARSEAYAGASTAGLMCACSFGTRAMPVAAKRLASSFLSAWSVFSWEEAARRAGELLSVPAGEWESLAENAASGLEEHWEKVRRALRPGPGEPASANKRQALDGLKSIGEQYLGEEASMGGVAVSRLLEAREEISRLKQRNAELERETAALERWMQSVNELFPALLGSRQWRTGRLLHELYRRLRRRPRVPTAATQLVNTLQQYRSWRHGSSARPVKIPESSLETRARRVLELADSNRDLPSALRSVSGRAVGYGKRRARLEYRKLKPRMSKEDLARRIRQRLGAAPQMESWPTVSVVVLNRNGLPYLRELLHGLEHRTDYPAEKLELILVDNASTDASVEFVESSDTSFEVKVIRNARNLSFSEANNQGAELASGDLLLFLNNDIEPFEGGWLKELVALRQERRAAAAGARLVYPGVTEHDAPSGYALQHRGVGFRRASGEEWHRNAGMGEDALDERLGTDEERPAVTAACMLVERSAFDSAGGFDPGYRYGSEDVDLCLKLLGQGENVLCSGRAVLFHDESPSQKAEGRQFMRANRSSNRKLFWERWGPELNRRCRLERLAGGSFWTFERAPHIALTVTSKDPGDGYGDWHTAHEMGEALQAAGWRVTYVERKGERWYSLPEDLDYLMVLIDLYDISRAPEGVTTIAWIRNWTERWVSHPWFSGYDVVLASSSISREIIEKNSAKKVDALFPIATNPSRFHPTPTEAGYEADYVFTGNFWGELRGVVDALEVGSRETFRIFGKGWENVPAVARYAQGTLPYDELAKVYSSSKLVIDDTASPTLPYGAINSRVFDALATGTPVITNCETGARELFDEEFPTYSDRESLREHLDSLLSDPGRREELGERYRRMVLEEHTYEKRAQQLSRILRRRAQAMGFCIKIGAPNRKEAENWGDMHYARAMKKQLEAAGHPCIIQTLDEWDSLEGLAYDVVIHLKGLTPYETKPSQVNILWNISHPEKLTAGECERYDLVFVASRRWADSLASHTDTPVHPLQQATDPEVFHPDYDASHDHDLVFVGNSRRVRRRILGDLLSNREASGYDLAVWGKDWQGLIDSRYVVGEYLPNEEVRKAYSSASIVLNDHWDDMREHGFISNRIYDALASGALVISDRIEELEEEFGEAVVTYEGAQELKELVDYYLSHPSERERRARRGRDLVLERHTFERRISELLERLGNHLRDEEPRQRLESLDKSLQPANPDSLA